VDGCQAAYLAAVTLGGIAVVALIAIDAGAIFPTPAAFWTDAPLPPLGRWWPWLLYPGGVATRPAALNRAGDGATEGASGAASLPILISPTALSTRTLGQE